MIVNLRCQSILRSGMGVQSRNGSKGVGQNLGFAKRTMKKGRCLAKMRISTANAYYIAF